MITPQKHLHVIATPLDHLSIAKSSINEDRGTVKFVCYRGSIAHNTYVESDKVESDTDLLASYVAPLDQYIGIDDVKDNGSYQYTKEGYDIVYYETKKFLRLLLHGNPNVFPYLWNVPTHILTGNSFTKNLIKHRDAFVSQRLHDTFIGYSFSQYGRMYKTTGNVGEKRRALINKIGYDPKYAHHAIRLMRMYAEFLATGEFQVYRTTDREELIDIKLGNWNPDEIRNEYLRLRGLTENGKYALPKNPDYEVVNELCRQEIFCQIQDSVEIVLIPQ